MEATEVVRGTARVRKGGAGPRLSASRGFSVLEALLTLFILSLALFAALRMVERLTRIPRETPARDDLGSALRSASEALGRDLTFAGNGRLPIDEAIIPLRDNTSGGLVLEATGDSTIVRAGTDEIAVRGVLRSPLLALDAFDRSSGRPFSAPSGSGLPGEIQQAPGRALLKIYLYPLFQNARRSWIVSSAFPGAEGLAWHAPGSRPARHSAPGRANEGLEAAVSQLRPAPAYVLGKRFFLVADLAGRYAVARVVSLEDRRSPSDCSCVAPSPAPGDCPPGTSGCFVEITLDFTDADAAAFNRHGNVDAVHMLGPLATGGVFDEVVYFVARGDLARPPEYSFASDPPTVSYPHPYLAAARSVGGGRFEISRVAEDIEDFQVAWGLNAGGRVEWRADRPGSPPARSADLLDTMGRPLLRVVKIAVVAKSASRGPKIIRLPEVSVPPTLNAPQPDPSGRGPAPVGWDPDPRRRVPYEREVRVFSVTPLNYTKDAPL